MIHMGIAELMNTDAQGHGQVCPSWRNLQA